MLNWEKQNHNEVTPHTCQNGYQQEDHNNKYWWVNGEKKTLVHCSEKAMAPHSSALAWKIPWMEEPGGLQSVGSLRVGHDWATSLSLHLHALEKEMTTSVLAWRILGMEEPGGLLSMWSHRVGHDLAAAAVHCWRECKLVQSLENCRGSSKN